MDSIRLSTSRTFTNDIYFMETVADKVIVNDNYQGIMILDNHLNLNKCLKLIDHLVIDMSFVKKEEILLVCYENQCMIHIDTVSFPIASFP